MSGVAGCERHERDLPCGERARRENDDAGARAPEQPQGLGRNEEAGKEVRRERERREDRPPEDVAPRWLALGAYEPQE